MAKVRKCEPIIYATMSGEERQNQNPSANAVQPDLVTATFVSNFRIMAVAKKKQKDMAELMSKLINPDLEICQHDCL